MTDETKKLIDAATNAHATIGGFYKWLDMVDELGGATNVAGVAKVHAMLESMRKNRKRIDTLVTEPLIGAIEGLQNANK